MSTITHFGRNTFEKKPNQIKTPMLILSYPSNFRLNGLLVAAMNVAEGMGVELLLADGQWYLVRKDDTGFILTTANRGLSFNSSPMGRELARSFALGSVSLRFPVEEQPVEVGGQQAYRLGTPTLVKDSGRERAEPA